MNFETLNQPFDPGDPADMTGSWNPTIDFHDRTPLFPGLWDTYEDREDFDPGRALHDDPHGFILPNSPNLAALDDVMTPKGSAVWGEKTLPLILQFGDETVVLPADTPGVVYELKPGVAPASATDTAKETEIK